MLLLGNVSVFQISVCPSESNLSNKLVSNPSCPKFHWPSVLTSNPMFSIPLPCQEPFPFSHTPHYLYLFMLLLCALVLFYLPSATQHKLAYATSKLVTAAQSSRKIRAAHVWVSSYTNGKRFSPDSETIYCQVHFPPHGSTRISQRQRATRTCGHTQNNTSCTRGYFQRRWKLSG